MSTYTPVKVFINKFLSSSEQNSWKLSLPLMDKVEIFLLQLFLTICKRLEPVIYVKTESDINPKLLAVAAQLKRAGICEDISYIQDEGSGYYRVTAKKTVPHGVNLKTIHSNGVDKDKDIAFSKALGEITERVVGGLLDQNRKFHKNSLNDITSEYYDPTIIHRYTKKQLATFSWLNADRNKEIDWVEGVSLAGGTKVFIPKSLTSWYRKSSQDNEYLISRTTNGSAGYFTKEGAVLRGLLEVIERDAFLVHWLNNIAPPIITIDSLPEILLKQVNEIRQNGEIFIIDTMTEVGLPSVVVVFIQKSGHRESVSVSAASRVTYHKAVEDALKEMVPCSRYSRSFLLSKMEESQKIDSYVADLGKEDRVKWWVGENRREIISWFLGGKTQEFSFCETKDVAQEDISDTVKLEIIKNKLTVLGKGCEPFVYYPKHQVLNQVGFCVAQVFVPKLLPMYLVEYLGSFESDRLREFALYKKIPFKSSNPVPHPLS